MMTAAVTGLGIGLGAGLVIMTVAAFLEHTRLGQRIDRGIENLMSAGL